MCYPDKWLLAGVKLQRMIGTPPAIYKPGIHLFSPDPWLLLTPVILEKRRVGRGSKGGRKKKSMARQV